MKHELLRYLVCPDCKAPLELESEEEASGEIYSGALHCKNKECVFPIKGYVPRFVDTELYADSFSKQRLYVRKHFKYYRSDRSGEKLFLPTTGFLAEDLRRDITLEIGCGYGRFLDVVNRLGGEVIGVDLSTHSIELAQDFVGLRRNVHLVQCDLFRMPFAFESFPRIFSIGVLHHTPDTRAAFLATLPYLEKGGEIAIWVYPPKMIRSANRWRRVTTRVPHSWLYCWCILNEILFSWVRALPGGWRFGSVIPGDALGKSHFWLRVMSDFDALSPKFAHTQSGAELRSWFAESGLADVEILARASSAKGRKPK